MEDKIEKLRLALDELMNSDQEQRIYEGIKKQLSGAGADACGVDLNHPVVRRLAEVIVDITSNGSLTLDAFLSGDVTEQ